MIILSSIIILSSRISICSSIRVATADEGMGTLWFHRITLVTSPRTLTLDETLKPPGSLSGSVIQAVGEAST